MEFAGAMEGLGGELSLFMDNDRYDSSSSDSHSSPSEGDTNATTTSSNQWAYELGLSIPSGMIGLPQSLWTTAQHNEPSYGLKSHDWRAGSTPPPQLKQPATEGEMSLTSDFWSQHNITQQSSPPHTTDNDQYSLRGADSSTDGVVAAKGMDVDFDDVYQQKQSGPSLIASPEPTPPSFGTSLATDTSAAMSNAFSTNRHDLSLSMTDQQFDNSGNSAGIAPQLTGGQPTPPLEASNQLPVDDSTMVDQDEADVKPMIIPSAAPLRPKSTRQQRSRRNSNDADVSRSNSRENSVSRRGSMANTAAGDPSSRRKKSSASGAQTPSVVMSQAQLVGASTNLVTKEPVVASNVITALSATSSASSRTHLANNAAGQLELLVLGVPIAGAKSRVETQIKISLVLVRNRSKKPQPTNSASEAEGELAGQKFMTLDGALEPSAGKEYERIGAWTHIRLPSVLALKKKAKKQTKPDPAAADTLTLEVSVNRGSEPYDEIFICDGCQAREHKRAQRKKDSQQNQQAQAQGESSTVSSELDERRKVVVFNTPEYVEFSTGEVVLPTRITCYCRHHKERKGFAVNFSLRDSRGVVVAKGITPPIMITDDHKTKDPTKLNPTQLSAALTAASQEAAAEQSQVKPKKTKAASKKATTSTTKPKRSNGRAKASRGSPESEDEAASSLPGSGTSTPATGSAPRATSASRKAKPYDADSRPAKKRVSGASSYRSPAFAMTPLVGLSPPLRAVDVSGTISAIPSQAPSPATASSFYSAAPSLSAMSPPSAPMAQVPSEQYLESALGLGGMTSDSIMTDQMAAPRGSFSAATEYSSGPSPRAAFEWRSSNSSPAPLSPRSNATSANASEFQSFCNTLQSPVPLGTTVQSIGSPVQEQRMYGSQSSSFGAFAMAQPAGGVSPLGWLNAQHQARSTPQPPRINRLIPGEGPVHGGIEVTVLGENFVPDLTCVFGDSPAVPTHFWSSNTLVCVLPPSANPGPVVVGIKGVPLTVEQGSGLQLFTYKDDSDRSLLELALQVVGLKMTGRLEDASAVAMRIVGNSNHHNGQASIGGGGSGDSNGSSSGARTAATMTTMDTAALAQQLNMAATTVYATPSSSRPQSRRTSLADDSTPPPLPYTSGSGEARNFEGIVIKFLSLLDLDPSLIPGAAPSLPSSRPPISHLNAQQHNLLHLACVLGFHRLVQFLIARNIDIDARDRNGFAPLHFAALYGRVAITRQLLDAGANPIGRNRAGKTAMDIAHDRDDVDVEEILQRARATLPSSSPTTRSNYGSPPVSQLQSQLNHNQHLLERHFRIVSRSADSRALSRTSAPPSRQVSAYASPATTDSESTDESDFDELSDDLEDSSDEEESEEDSSESDGESDDDRVDVEQSFSNELERRLSRSRNASMVSLHYLLEAEESAREQHGAPPTPEWQPDIKVASAPLAEGDTKSTDAARDTAAKSLEWPFPGEKDSHIKLNTRQATLQNKLQPLSDGVTDMWEKAANRFSIPIQMPELTAFHAMAHSMPSPFSWRSAKSDTEEQPEGEGQGGGPGTDSDATIVPSRPTPREEKSSRDWRHLYTSSWFKSPSSPPPSYSPRDHLHSAPLPSSPSDALSTPTASTSTLPMSPAPLPNRSRRSCRAAEHQSYAKADASLHSVKHDKMLWFFWMPVLLFVLSFALYANFHHLAPLADAALETVLPRSVARLLH